VAHDRRVGEQALNVAVAEGGDPVGIEPFERGAKALALAQDRQPAEPGLETLETQSLVEPALIADGATPLLVVVGDVERVGRRPAADELYFSRTSTWTMPSSTVTG
jgi:hypothetical protein